jgi:uncharacterized protein (DUF433 family)
MGIVGDIVRMPPRGHYLAWEAGQLAGVSGNAIGQWGRRGYIRPSQSDGVPKIYSYQDVAEAMVVHQLLDHGASYRLIRKTLDELRKDPGLGDWPLSQVELSAAGSQSLLVRRRGGEHFDLTGRPWHAMLDAGDLRKIATDLNRGGWAARRIPGLRHIEVDPDRLSGRPVIRGRRVAAQDVAETAEEPRGREELEEGYGLKLAEIEDARNWWCEVRRLAA